MRSSYGNRVNASKGRIGIFFLALILVASATVIVASMYDDDEFSAEIVTIDGTTYVLNDKDMTATLQGTDPYVPGDKVFDVVTNDGKTYRITSIIHNAFSNHTLLTSISIPNVTIIGNSAFYNCTSLSSVYMPSVTTIGNCAFQDCTSLSSVTMPNIMTIGNTAFTNTSITTMPDLPRNGYTFSDGLIVKDGTTAISFTTGTECVIPSGVTTIGESAFQSCKLTSVTMQDVTFIGKAAFQYCGKLESATMPCVTSIGEWAFQGCTLIQSTSMPNVTFIGDRAFRNCTSLSSVSMPKATTIEDYGFQDCTSLSSVSMPKIMAIGAAAFTNTSITTMPDLPLNGYTFNDGLIVKDGTTAISFTTGTECNIPSGVTAIAYNAFQKCGISSVTMPDVTAIGVNAFNGCVSLTSVSMPKVISIGDYAFHDCKLGTVEMPEVVCIGKYAFGGCKSLTSVKMPSATTIGGSAFIRCKSLTSIDVPEATFIGNSAFGECELLESVKMPNVTSIDHNAFEDCIKLTNVEMPNATFIESNAFGDCISLTSVKMPNATFIGNRAFQSCGVLESVEMPNVEIIGGSVFYGCKSLTSVEIPKTTSVGNNAFNGCTSLTSVKIPNATLIGFNAFDYCTGLKLMEFPNAVTIDSNAFVNCNVLSEVILLSGTEGTGDVLSNYFKGSSTNGILPGMKTATITKLVIKFDAKLDDLHAVKDNILWISPLATMTSGNDLYASDGNSTLTGGDRAGLEYKYTDGKWISTGTVLFEVETFVDDGGTGKGGHIVGGGTYRSGDDVTLKVLKNPNYVFKGWSDHDMDVEKNFTASAETTDSVYTVYFEAIIHTITVESNDISKGTVRIVGYDGCEEEIIQGTPLELVATPIYNYEFVRWENNDPNPKRLITVTGDMTYTAYFREKMHTVIVNIDESGNGMITVDIDGDVYGPTVDYKESIHQGSKITIKAIPDEGYGFYMWSDGNKEAERTVTVLKGVTYTAYFKKAYVVEVTSDDEEMGSASGSDTYLIDEQVTIKAIPNKNYRFVKWNDDGPDNTKAERKITVTGNVTYTAIFEKIMRTITVNVGENGGGTTEGSGIYHQGSTITIKAIPEEGYRFVKWEDSGMAGAERTVTVLRDRTYTAIFEPTSSTGTNGNNGDGPGNMMLYLGMILVIIAIIAVSLYMIFKKPKQDDDEQDRNNRH